VPPRLRFAPIAATSQPTQKTTQAIAMAVWSACIRSIDRDGVPALDYSGHDQVVFRLHGYDDYPEPPRLPTGSRTSTVVPMVGGLVSVKRPLLASTRSSSPVRPVP
jgi:hypothetical protein